MKNFSLSQTNCKGVFQQNHNVEYVAAEKIGAERVTYVANIYKYYIAYRLIMETKAEREQAVEKIKQEKGKAGTLAACGESLGENDFRWG
jgi:hypothetical protein